MMRSGVVAVGLAVVVACIALVDLPVRDSLAITAFAGLAALVTGGVGGGVLHLLRRRSFFAQVSVVALTSTVAVAAGTLAVGYAMFISAHDLNALAVVVVVAGFVGVLAAFTLAFRVDQASRSLGEAARRIGDPAAPRSAPPSILEFRRLAAELEETGARLEEARVRELATEAARRELVAWVSHDLRTPLSGIRAVTEALEDGLVDDPETVRRYLVTLRVEADRLTGLVNDLFELSRIHAGALRLTMEPVSLGDLISDALAAAGPVAEAKGVTVEGRMDGVVELEASPPELARVLRNLLDNAIRQTPPGGEVSVEASGGGGRAFFAVSDSCGGIPDDDLSRVFEAGFRGEAARTPTAADGGAGLGLAIARGLVEAHRGELSVANTATGCRFVVTLPA
ncbi:MAG: sensor histidine kinase [Egibacteraceae bacterium]